MGRDDVDFLGLTRELCAFATGVVADDNEPLFDRIGRELPLRIHRFRSGDTHNGWLVPDNWRVERALIRRDGKTVFDATAHTLGVARYSRSFQGTLEWEELRPHLVTSKDLPDAYVFHCQWQYRPWDADWALSVPYSVYETLGPGEYEIDLVTHYADGDMIVADFEQPGRSDATIVFHSNNCHPHMANDGFAGTTVLIRLFQWLRTQETNYTYRLVIGPEHIGTVFYLRDHSEDDLGRIVSGVFAEMPGTQGPIKAASTFLGGQMIDSAFRNVCTNHASSYELVPWRQGAGNDETVWEAPGYEVPFVELTRSEELLYPYREYHTSLDAPDLMDEAQLFEFYDVLRRVVDVLENNAVMHRRFDGLISLSNPEYGLYMERRDPSVEKDLTEDSEAWGYLVDCLLRYFDGRTTVLEVAERHGLPFEAVASYVRRFAEAGLIDLEFAPITRARPTRVETSP